MLLDVEKLFPAESMTIMIVDDTKDNINILRQFLAKFGFKTTVAFNGEMALDLIPKLKPDLILLDVMMPGIDGYEVCIRLKKDKDLKTYPLSLLQPRETPKIS
jgi:CheY-like chemotaxis protein